MIEQEIKLRLEKIERDIADIKDVMNQAKGATRALWIVFSFLVALFAFFGGKVELLIKWLGASEGRTP